MPPITLFEALTDETRLQKLRTILENNDVADPVLDGFTRLASRALGTPVSLLSLVEVDQQVFKSQIGLPEPWASSRCTPLSHSFCQHVLPNQQPLIVSDARVHPLVQDNPAIDDLGIIAYAGIPFITTDGFTLGSFCVIDHEPRQWSDEDIAILRDIAAAAMAHIELRHEVAERKRVEQALRETTAHHRRILNRIHDVIVVMDRDSRIMWANRAFREAYDLMPPESDTLYDPAYEPIAAQGDCWATNRDVLANGSIVTQDCTPLNMADGGMPYMHIVKLPLFDEHGVLTITVNVARDISDRKLLEDALREAVLEQHHISDLKSRFITTVSHEFRTPLSIILSSTELLSNYGDRMEPERRGEHLQRVKDQVSYIVSMMEDVVSYDDQERSATAPDWQRLDLAKLCHTIAIEEQARRSYDVRFEDVSNTDLAIISDEKLLRQIIGHLIINGIKYSPENTPIYMTLDAEDDAAILSIRDEGYGMKAEDLPYIFEPFYRGTNIGNIAGTGMGLAIVQRAVVALNGTITCESEFGTGTTFVIHLPRSQD